MSVRCRPVVELPRKTYTLVRLAIDWVSFQNCVEESLARLADTL